MAWSSCSRYLLFPLTSPHVCTVTLSRTLFIYPQPIDLFIFSSLFFSSEPYYSFTVNPLDGAPIYEARTLRSESFLSSSPSTTARRAHVLSPGSNAPQRIPNAGALTLGGGKGLEKNQTGGLRTERWVKRQQLTRAPKTAEEIALDDKEVSP